MDSEIIYLDKCSCIICHKVYPRKGIGTHYHINHIKGNKEKHHQRSKKASIKGGEATKNKYNKIREKNLYSYNLNPNSCEWCKAAISYDLRNNRFCSKQCSAKYNNQYRKGIPISDETRQKISQGVSYYANHVQLGKSIKLQYRNCSYCNKIFIYHPSNSTYPKHCSSECLTKNRSYIGRTSRGLGNKRSKDEIKLFELLSEYFENIRHTHIISDGWDTDIALLDYNIAIFWNGPWHYKEMNIGNHSLKQVQNRDKIKTKLFESLGWHVIVYEDRHFTPQTAFLDLINRLF